MLRKFDGGRCPRVWDIVTGDKTWVCQYDLEKKKRSEVLVFPVENPPVKCKRNRSAPKQMVECFFANFGHVPPYRLRTERRIRLTGMSTTVCLKYSRHGVNGVPRTGVRGLLFHHDNASVHTSAVSLDFLVANDIQLVTRPPYSPDLASCD